VFAQATAQLDEYFAGERREFALELDLAGTAFQERVWRALLAVPYGSTTTYGTLARQLGVTDSPTVPAARKVGWAIAATPTPILVPCHRVVAADGSLTGYRGGLDRKRALLDFEAAGGELEALRHGRHQQLALL
jgi:methylated-DNA-[protein]-cysteine S-methyltransferase